MGEESCLNCASFHDGCDKTDMFEPNLAHQETYRLPGEISPDSGLDAVAYNFFGMRPDK